jgi:hypothetical protein
MRDNLRAQISAINSELRDRDAPVRPGKAMPCLTSAASLGYSCPEQRPTEILQHPRSTVFCPRGRKSGKSLQTPT